MDNQRPELELRNLRNIMNISSQADESGTLFKL